MKKETHDKYIYFMEDLKARRIISDLYEFAREKKISRTFVSFLREQGYLGRVVGGSYKCNIDVYPLILIVDSYAKQREEAEIVEPAETAEQFVTRMLTGLTPKTLSDFLYSTFYVNRDGKLIVEIEKEKAWCRYLDFWEVLETKFDLEYIDIQTLVKTTLEQALKAEGVTPNAVTASVITRLEQKLPVKDTKAESKPYVTNAGNMSDTLTIEQREQEALNILGSIMRDNAGTTYNIERISTTKTKLL